MSEQKAFLEKIHIKNYRSLRNVTLPIKTSDGSCRSECKWEVKYLEIFRTSQRYAKDLKHRLQRLIFSEIDFGQGGADYITCELHAQGKGEISKIYIGV